MSAEAGPSRVHKPKTSEKQHKSHRDKSSKTKSSSTPSKTKQAGAAPEASGSSQARHVAQSKDADDGLDSPFKTVRSTIRLSIPPVFAMDLRRGAEELLDSLVMRYSPPLRAVLLSYSNVEFEDPSGANIVNDCPFAVCQVSFDAVVWKPEPGMKLAGIHSISTASHISLIIYKTFNITIPLPYIPLDTYEFDESASEAIIGEREGSAGLELTEEEEEEREEMSEGRWRRKGRGGEKGELVGKDGQDVVFTVVGLHVSNQMLSLTGSLLIDPSAPQSVPEPSAGVATPAPGTQLARERATIPTQILEHGVAAAVGHEPGEGLLSGPTSNSNKRAGKSTNLKTKAVRDTEIAAAKAAVRGPSTPVELINTLREDAEDPFREMEQGNVKKLEEAKRKSKEEKAAKKAEKAKRKAEESASRAPADAGEEQDEKTDEVVPPPAKKQRKRPAEDSADKDGHKKKRKKD